MGLFGKRRDAVRDPIRAQARIAAMAPTERGARQTGKLDVEYSFRLEVQAAGGGTYECDHTCVVPHAKMPALGHTVPLEVARDDPGSMRILFDEMPDLADRARGAAAAAAQGDAAATAAALGFTLKDPPPGP